MNSVERGRWKLVISTSTARNRSPGVRNKAVSPENGRKVPSSAAAVSSRRNAVASVGATARGDIGRQRHVAALVDRLVEHRSMEREGERHLAFPALGLDGRIELAEKAHLAFLAETNDVAGRKFLRRAHQGVPARSVEALDQRRLDARLLTAADAPAGKPRGDHLGVVEDERV